MTKRRAGIAWLTPRVVAESLGIGDAKIVNAAFRDGYVILEIEHEKMPIVDTTPTQVVLTNTYDTDVHGRTFVSEWGVEVL